MRETYINGGWQFDVFDLGLRVRKKKKRLLRFIRKNGWILPSSSIYARTPRRLYCRILAVYFLLPKSLTTLKSKLEAHPFLAPLFGNPVFLSDTEYEQDKATPIAQIYSGLTTQEKIRILKKLVKLVRTMWLYGIADGDLSNLHNFQKNYGLNAQGELVSLDLGNIISNLSQARKVTRRLLKKCTKVACGEKIKEHLSPGVLDALWNKYAN